MQARLARRQHDLALNGLVQVQGEANEIVYTRDGASTNTRPLVTLDGKLMIRESASRKRSSSEIQAGQVYAVIGAPERGRCWVSSRSPISQ